MAKILLADDNAIIRRIFRRVLAERPEWEVCAEASNGVEALAMVKRHRPDVAVLDLSMPSMSGVQAAKEIIAACPNTLVVAESMHEICHLRGALKSLGVKAFVPKMRMVIDLLPAIEAVLGGGTWFQDVATTH
jgi:DNA-binding NarL/FixJ family response regulator